MLRLPAESNVTTTSVIWKGGSAWFAVAVNHELRIYRWRSAGWVLDGAVILSREMPSPAPESGLASTSITRGVAPDFTAHFVGADTWWFAFVGRLGGRWRVVPFDDQFRRRDPYTFAYGASHGLIHGIFDACGCASGPTTQQWYRYAQGTFVATRPPGHPASCSSTALAAAGHWPPLPDDPLVRNVGHGLSIGRFACADGWALATDGHKVAVYEQPGPPFSQPVGSQWLRVAIGTPRRVGGTFEFALPRSVLRRLGEKIGISVGAAPRQPTYPPERPLTAWQKAPITAAFRPGDTYVAADLYRRPGILTVKIYSSHRTRVMRYRWANGAWVRLPTG